MHFLGVAGLCRTILLGSSLQISNQLYCRTYTMTNPPKHSPALRLRNTPSPVDNKGLFIYRLGFVGKHKFGKSYSSHQREGMVLLEYQAMSSLRDLAHYGWLCTFTYITED
jgi:hypothetical protein